MRKISGYEFSHVQLLKNIIIRILDGLIAGDDLDQVILNGRNNSGQKQPNKVTSKPKHFFCDVCNWETNYASALKTHKTRIHNYEKPNTKPVKILECVVCDFKSDDN